MIDHEEEERRYKKFRAHERQLSLLRCVGAALNLALSLSGLILSAAFVVQRLTEGRWFHAVFFGPLLGVIPILCAYVMVKHIAAELHYQKSEMTAAQYLGKDAEPVPDSTSVVMTMIVLALLHFVLVVAIWPDYLSAGESDSPPPEELRYDGYK